MIANIVLAFFRVIGRLFRGTGTARRAATKAGSGLAAKKIPRNEPPRDDELAEEVSGGIEAIMFRQLARPRLSEQSAADLTIEEARRHLKQAEVFYSDPFNLFARSDFFYEEVEEEYLNNALGLQTASIDARFLQIMSLFRRTLNDNTRRLMLVYAPIILILSFAVSLMVAKPLAATINNLLRPYDINLVDPVVLGSILAFSSVSIGAFMLAFLVFSWPFKVAQQRNLLNLDNYLTSKFARINHNFQVAKRRALNVERNKRMSQTEELKEEAGVWTLSYQWFAMRLLLCELMIRNRLYQVRRNTILYWLAGIGMCLTIGTTGALIAPFFLHDVTGITIGIFVATIVYIILTYAVFQRTTSMFSTVLEANEWSRFHLVDLHKTIQDHVGEDKVQIVTFRDRNRME